MVAVLCALAIEVAASVPAEAHGNVVTSASSVTASDGKSYSITNHLTRDAWQLPLRTPHEYLLVWAGDAGPGAAGTPEPDFLAVVDATKGTREYGKVVNTVTVDSIFGNEPHHTQYVWHKGDKVYAGGIFADTTYVFDVARLPLVKLSGIVLSSDTPCGSAPDAYTVLNDGTAYATQMGGPDVTGPCTYSDGQVRLGNGFAGTPGEVVRIDQKGKVLVEAPASTPNPEDPRCIDIPQLNNGSCANPHGIAAREDLDRLVTSDLVEVRVMINPTAPPPADTARTSVRMWDISDRAHPKLASVSYLPNGPRPAIDPYGIGQSNFMVMETAVTNKHQHRGAFASTMSGGAIFYTPDITVANPVWREVFDDAAAFKAVFPTDTPLPGTDGGSWLAVSPDDHYLYHTVLGGALNSPAAHADAGLVYVLDIRKLLASGSGTQCSVDTMAETSTGGVEADCPTVSGALPVVDPTSGGPHWAALDNFKRIGPFYRETAHPARLAVADYFVYDTYIDGNHQVCMVDVADDGKLTLDTTFKDETTKAPCVDFNRTNWPHGATGPARPHGVLFVVGDNNVIGRTPFDDY